MPPLQALNVLCQFNIAFAAYAYVPRPDVELLPRSSTVLLDRTAVSAVGGLWVFIKY